MSAHFVNSDRQRVGRDSYDQQRVIDRIDSGVRSYENITLLNSFTSFSDYPFRVIARQVGSSVYVQALGAITCSNSNSGDAAFYMPDELCPKQRIGFMLCPLNGTSPNQYHSRVLIDSNGLTRIYWPSAFTIGEVLMAGINYFAKE